MKLSILITTSKETQANLNQLIGILMPQTKDFEGDIHVDIEGDPKMTYGSKLNSLLKDAIGKYVWILEDTDLISESAISDIFHAIESEPDFIVINGATKTVEHVSDWTLDKPGIQSPMKREHALLKPFRKRKVNAVEIWLKELTKISPFITHSVIEKPILRKNIGLTVVK